MVQNILAGSNYGFRPYGMQPRRYDNQQDLQYPMQGQMRYIVRQNNEISMKSATRLSE